MSTIIGKRSFLNPGTSIRAEGANHPSISVGLDVKRDVCSDPADIIPVWGALPRKRNLSPHANLWLPQCRANFFVCVVTEGNGIAAKSAGR